MKDSIAKKLIFVLIVIVMVIPIIIEATKAPLQTIKYSDLENVTEGTTNYNFSIVYVASKEDEATLDERSNIEEMMESIISPATQESCTAYYMDYDKLTDSEKEAIFGDSTSKKAYILITNGTKPLTLYDDKTIAELNAYAMAYSGNGVEDSLVNYKVAENAKEFSKIIKKKNEVTMVVFGKESCFYCNQYLPLYNQVAEEENLDIYYFDSDNYDKDEYTKVMELGLKIPASCNDGEEIDLQEGFGTPLTLFIKNGKAIDCISGYVNKDTLVTKLQTVGLIETDTEE